MSRFIQIKSMRLNVDSIVYYHYLNEELYIWGGLGTIIRLDGEAGKIVLNELDTMISAKAIELPEGSMVWLGNKPAAEEAKPD